MQRPTERAGSYYPLVRVFTLGDFALERLAAAPTTQGGQPRYEPLAPQAWASRGPAMTLLKVLLCRPGRRASRGELTAAIWPGDPPIDADHALDSAASVLRRHVLAVPEGGSLLLTLRSGGETLLKLPGQRRLWVDADALLEMVSAGLRAELLGQSPLPPLEMALALARGEFLEDDLYAEWSQGRRHTVSGARRRALYRLVRLYQQEGRGELAEELLFTALEQDPTDEDALCRLMVLLVEQGRRQEALQLYQYSLDVLREEGSEPASYTRELAQRTRRGHVLRERGEGYGSLATGTQASGRGRCWIGGQWAGRRGYLSGVGLFFPRCFACFKQNLLRRKRPRNGRNCPGGRGRPCSRATVMSVMPRTKQLILRSFRRPLVLRRAICFSGKLAIVLTACSSSPSPPTLTTHKVATAITNQCRSARAGSCILVWCQLHPPRLVSLKPHSIQARMP